MPCRAKTTLPALDPTARRRQFNDASSRETDEPSPYLETLSKENNRLIFGWARRRARTKQPTSTVVIPVLVPPMHNKARTYRGKRPKRERAELNSSQLVPCPKGQAAREGLCWQEVLDKSGEGLPMATKNHPIHNAKQPPTAAGALDREVFHAPWWVRFAPIVANTACTEPQPVKKKGTPLLSVLLLTHRSPSHLGCDQPHPLRRALSGQKCGDPSQTPLVGGTQKDLAEWWWWGRGGRRGVGADEQTQQKREGEKGSQRQVQRMHVYERVAVYRPRRVAAGQFPSFAVLQYYAALQVVEGPFGHAARGSALWYGGGNNQT